MALIDIEAPANRTEGLKNFVAMIHNELERGNVDSAKLLTIDLLNDIGGAYVCKEDDIDFGHPIFGHDADISDSEWSSIVD